MCNKTIRTLINEKSGQQVETTMTDMEAATAFANLFGGKDHWLHFWVHKYVMERQRDAETGNLVENAIDFIRDAFLIAIGRGLKRPMIRAHYKDQRFKIYLSQKGTICLKSGMLDTQVLEDPFGDKITYTHDPIGDEFYIGCLLRGKFLGAQLGSWESYGRNRPERKMTTTETEFLDGLKADPIGFLAKCSKDMDRCCYCHQPLEDPRSKAIGYGKVCASRWGLPWGDESYMEKAPSFAKAYNSTASALCTTVRNAPKEGSNWAILADWLEENGLPRVEMPGTGVTLPRND